MQKSEAKATICASRGQGGRWLLPAVLLIVAAGSFRRPLWAPQAGSGVPPGAGPRGEQQAVAEPPWLIVRPEAVAAFDRGPVGQVCFGGAPPKLLRSAPLVFPAGDPLQHLQYVWAVHCGIDQQGAVVKAQILKGPDTPTIRRALVESLRQWRFAPAMRGGQPAAVHFTVLVSPAGAVAKKN
jgi:TonB family protein